MNLNKIKLVYFSPTKTTQTILSAIAKGSGTAEVEHIDLTPPSVETKNIDEMGEELVVDRRSCL